jgi:head-tail adaptor
MVRGANALLGAVNALFEKALTAPRAEMVTATFMVNIRFRRIQVEPQKNLIVNCQLVEGAFLQM